MACNFSLAPSHNHSLTFTRLLSSIDEGAFENLGVSLGWWQLLPLPWTTNSIPPDSIGGDWTSLHLITDSHLTTTVQWQWLGCHYNRIATGLMTAAATAICHCWHLPLLTFAAIVIWCCCHLPPLPFDVAAICHHCHLMLLPFAITAIYHSCHLPSLAFAITDICICCCCHGPLNSTDGSHGFHSFANLLCHHLVKRMLLMTQSWCLLQQAAVLGIAARLVVAAAVVATKLILTSSIPFHTAAINKVWTNKLFWHGKQGYCNDDTIMMTLQNKWLIDYYIGPFVLLSCSVTKGRFIVKKNDKWHSKKNIVIAKVPQCSKKSSVKVCAYSILMMYTSEYPLE